MNTTVAIHFFEAMYGDCKEGYLTLWTKQGKKTYWFEVIDYEEAAATAVQLARMKRDVYFGVALRKEELPAPQRGSIQDVSLLPGVWMDIDIASDAHVQKDLPPNLDAAIQLLQQFPLPPSILVNSGHGLHGYWKFVEPWILDTEEIREQGIQCLSDFQGTIRNYAFQKGWKLDNTADLARVLRVPGTLNYKGDPIDVTILSENYSNVS
jgi:putative DNA primase/helicase